MKEIEGEQEAEQERGVCVLSDGYSMFVCLSVNFHLTYPLLCYE